MEVTGRAPWAQLFSPQCSASMANCTETASSSATNSRRRLANGTFTEVGLLSGVGYNRDGRSIAGMGVDFRDINNDGKPDIFETAMHGDSFPLYINSGNGFFEDATLTSHLHAATMPLTSWGTGIFDFDNDGWKDIFYFQFLDSG